MVTIKEIAHELRGYSQAYLAMSNNSEDTAIKKDAIYLNNLTTQLVVKLEIEELELDVLLSDSDEDQDEAAPQCGPPTTG